MGEVDWNKECSIESLRGKELYIFILSGAVIQMIWAYFGLWLRCVTQVRVPIFKKELHDYLPESHQEDRIFMQDSGLIRTYGAVKEWFRS